MERPPERAALDEDGARKETSSNLLRAVPPKNEVQRQGGTFVPLPSSREVDALIRRIPRGKLATIESFRAAIARQHGAAADPPGATRKLLRNAARAAAAAFARGESDVTPYWRIVRATGAVIGNLPRGTASLTALLTGEGHAIERKGQRAFVKDFDRCLVFL
jgi:alkylated DNA nucleotide flippase Atl1